MENGHTAEQKSRSSYDNDRRRSPPNICRSRSLEARARLVNSTIDSSKSCSI